MDLLESAPIARTNLSDAEIASLIAASQPKPVPAEYETLVVNVIGPRGDHRAANLFQKVWQLNAGAVGAQREDWREERPAAADSAHILNEAYFTGDTQLADLQDLLSALAKAPFSAVVLGRLLDTKRTDGARQGWFVDKRSQDFYGDAPTRLFPVDVDDLDCEPLDAADAIDDFISKFLPELEGCTYVWHHTGSSGIKSARVRLWFQLAKPRHLAAMRSYARLVNERASRVVIDASVYAPSHLIFTADPQIRDANGNPTRRPVPSGVWLADGDLVPVDAFADVVPGSPDAVSSASAGAPQEWLPKKAEGELLASLGPGNYDIPIHRWISSQACKAPDDAREEAAFQAAWATIHKRIFETCPPDALSGRLHEHCDERKLRRKWDRARDWYRKRRLETMASSPVVDDVLPSLGNLKVNTAGAGTLEDLTAAEFVNLHDELEREAVPMPIGEVRKKALADFIRIADSVLYKRQQGHWLDSLPAGAGKTKLLEYLARPGTLSSCRIRTYVPNHRLAEQLVADLRTAARAHPADPRLYGDLSSYIRHHKGRDQDGMCVDKESAPKAARAEKLGVSVKKTVCGACKSRDACQWLKQAADDDCGIVVETHAAALTKRGNSNVDFVIVDESIAASFIESGETTLAALSNTGTIRSLTLGGVSMATSDLRQCRDKLVAALRTAVPKEPDKPVLMVTAGWELFDFEGAIARETDLRAGLAVRIINREDNGRDASEWHAQLEASRHAAALYSAIAASTKCQRQHVPDLAIYAEKGETSEPLVRYAVRVGDAASVFGKASITLDGTANEDVWRAVVSADGTPPPGAVLGANVAVPDGVRVFQYIDKAGARSSLMPDLRPTKVEQKRRLKRETLAGARGWARDALGADKYDTDLATSEREVATDDTTRATRKRHAHANIELVECCAAYLAADAAGRAVDINGKPISVLLVAQKVVAEYLRPRMPTGVAVEHFGVLRGLNAYKDVPVVMIVGRIRPANIDLELMTAALHSLNPRVQAIARYDVSPKEGRPWLEQHPDHHVAALQSQITTAEVRQALARARIYDRSPDKPVDIHVFGQCDLGLPADRVIWRLWNDAKRSAVEIAAARGCVFADMRLNQRAYPGDLFPKGAKDGWGRVDREGKAKFADLVANLARHESRLKPYIEIEEGNPRSLLAFETGFKGDLQLGGADALDFSMDGTDAKPGRGHKLVKVRVAGAGKACLAIVAADWTEADVAQLVGAPVDKWIEQTADQLQALAVRYVIGAPDVR